MAERGFLVGAHGRVDSSTLVIRRNHQLITRGVYRFTRRLDYPGVIMAWIGVPVYASSLHGLLTMSALQTAR